MENWLTKFPDFHDFRYFLAIQYLLSNNSKSLAHFEVLYPEFLKKPEFLNNYSWALMEKDHAKALRLAKGSYQLNSSDVDIIDTYALALIKNHKHDMAKEILQKGLKVHKQNETLKSRLSTIDSGV